MSETTVTIAAMPESVSLSAILSLTRGIYAAILESEGIDPDVANAS